MSAQEGALSVRQVPKLFEAFQIDTNNKLNEDSDVQMFPAKNTSMPEYVMMACIYVTQNVDPKNSFYLKVLRHLGRKHPYIVNTWEIFSDEDQDEVDKYLSVQLTSCSEHFVLNWWREHSNEFPKLSQLAKWILSIPASVTTRERFKITKNCHIDDMLLFLHCNM